MADPLKATCPECGSVLFIERVTGKVLEVRRPVADQREDEDRFSALMRKAKTRGEAALEKFAHAKEKEKTKKDRLESLFKDAKEKVIQSGDIGPETRDIDLD
ncbi:MAG: hypothetical protein NTX50_20050 [Candidatus Sumerlaeota bacterium]|nr:hypothetical protein [Candidatus Sumerlaeota bacterium]